MKLPRLSCLLLILSLPVLATESPRVKNGPVEAQLVSDAAVIAPGQPFTVALRLQHEPHWHTYWIAPGTGYPTSLDWTLPPGFTAGEIQWPTPHIVQDSAGHITGNGYYDEICLLVEITPPADLAPGSEVRLAAAADWLMCETVCMPGGAKLEISFPTGTAQADSRWLPLLDATRAQLPDAGTGWTTSATHDGNTVNLRVTPPPGYTHQPTGLHFFSDDGLVDYALPQTIRAEQGGWVISMPLDRAADHNSPRLTGVLAAENGWQPGSGYDGLLIAAPLVGAGAPGTTGTPSTAGSPPPAATTLFGTLLLALLGGLVLNLMPCVFPVLGIKILGFVNQSGSDRKKIVLHGLIFALGVLLSFWLLAGVLLALRATGAQLGWGFQLQSPGFVFGMAAFLLIFALNLSGLFEVGLAATGVGGKLQMQTGYSGSFFTGALAVLVATPCSAPFLAPALGAALALSAFESLLVFTAIAIGLALPYLLLSAFPAAIRLLPKPGAWMETFKQLMAFPLYATVGWLLWVLAGQTRDNDNALLLILFGFVLVAMAAWAYGRFGQAHGQPGRQLFGRGLAALLLAGGFYLGWPQATPPPPTDGSYHLTWEKWSPAAVAAAQAEGRYVYVDFTARWCATCQTNKAAVFSSAEVLAALARDNVVLLKADWTSRDPLITAELAKWNRSAVPFNLFYGPAGSPVILPELLTPDRFLESLAETKTRR